MKTIFSLLFFVFTIILFLWVVIMTDEAILSALYGMLADDEEPQYGGSSSQRRNSFHLLFGDELKGVVDDGKLYI